MYEFFEECSNYNNKNNKTVFFEMMVLLYHLNTKNVWITTHFQPIYLYFLQQNQTTHTLIKTMNYIHRNNLGLYTEIKKQIRTKFALLGYILNFDMTDAATKITKFPAFDIFCNTQRLYHIMLRFIQRCKYNKMRTFDNGGLDMYLEPLENIPKKQIIILVQNGCKYKFNVKNLSMIIMTNLTHAVDIISYPSHIKNPYTNVLFSSTQLFNIYYFMLQNNLNIHLLIRKFSLFHFQIDKLRANPNACDTNIYIIKQFIQTENPTDEHNYYLHKMIYWFDKTALKLIRLHKMFPKKIAWNILKPYIYLYLCYYTSSVDCFKELLSYLTHFYVYNPTFGKRITATPHCKITYFKHYEFNTKHIPFHYVEPCFTHFPYQTEKSIFSIIPPPPPPPTEPTSVPPSSPV